MDIRFPNETDEYREARAKLLEAEAEMRRQTEKVAALRRALPVGGEVPTDYVFDALDKSGVESQVKLSELFGAHDTLLVYALMYGPNAKKPCPMCTSFLDSLNGNAPHVERQMSIVIAARSPIVRVEAYARGRGWNNLRLVSTANNEYPVDYRTESPEGRQLPMAHVFTKREGKIHHFWGSELLFSKNEEGQDPRHVDMLWPLWNVLDLGPEGRGKFYPKVEYVDASSVD